VSLNTLASEYTLNSTSTTMNAADLEYSISSICQQPGGEGNCISAICQQEITSPVDFTDHHPSFCEVQPMLTNSSSMRLTLSELARTDADSPTLDTPIPMDQVLSMTREYEPSSCVYCGSVNFYSEYVGSRHFSV
jgi:hypothetical protein